MIAGALAVLAASIAYCGVLMNLRHQKKTERRSRRIEQLLDAATAVEALHVYTLARRSNMGRYDPERRELLINEVYLAAAKLRVLDQTSAGLAIETYLAKYIGDMKAGIDNSVPLKAIEDAKWEALQACKVARHEVETK